MIGKIIKLACCLAIWKWTVQSCYLMYCTSREICSQLSALCFWYKKIFGVDIIGWNILSYPWLWRLNDTSVINQRRCTVHPLWINLWQTWQPPIYTYSADESGLWVMLCKCQTTCKPHSLQEENILITPPIITEGYYSDNTPWIIHIY